MSSLWSATVESLNLRAGVGGAWATGKPPVPPCDSCAGGGGSKGSKSMHSSHAPPLRVWVMRLHTRQTKPASAASTGVNPRSWPSVSCTRASRTAAVHTPAGRSATLRIESFEAPVRIAIAAIVESGHPAHSRMAP